MADKKHQGVGEVHTTSPQEPECQHKNGHHKDEHDEACKPDFDEKDTSISPSRKAAGPNLRTLTRSADLEESLQEQDSDQARPPEAKIKDDLPPESER